MTHLEIVADIDFLRHLICDKCNLCAFDCRYRCRYIREAENELQKIIVSTNCRILFSIPIENEAIEDLK